MERPRLVERLQTGLAGKLTLIAAPAGFGKTTLVSEWRASDASRDVSIVWVSLDAGDNDVARFWSYIITALDQIEPGVGATALELLQMPQLPPLEAILTPLVNALSTVPAHMALVLDDYHVIETPAIHQAPTFLLDHLPPHLHITLITRVDPPLPLSRLRARGELIELRAADLRFTPDEAATFLTEVMRLPLGADQIAALETRTEGWIAGLQFAALAMRDRADLTGFIAAFSGSNRFVMDYLADEVLDRLPAHLQTFVLQTSILDRMCGPLCDAVLLDDIPAQQGIHTSQSASSQPLLEELERANLFLTALDDDRRWYHYHHLFAEVVRTRLTNGMTAAAVAALHRRASTWYEAANMVDAAIDHALAGIDVARAAYLIGQIASLAIQKGELTTLLGWLDALPDDLVRANGELATYKGWVLILMGQTERAESYADAAERGLAVDTTTAVSRGRMLSLLGHLALRRQDSAESLDLATRALQLVGTTDPIFRSLILYTLIQAQRLRGDIAGAIQSMREAIQVDEQLGLSLTPMSYIAVLAVELYWQGRRREAVALWRFRREEF